MGGGRRERRTESGVTTPQGKLGEGCRSLEDLDQHFVWCSAWIFWNVRESVKRRRAVEVYILTGVAPQSALGRLGL